MHVATLDHRPLSEGSLNEQWPPTHNTMCVCGTGVMIHVIVVSFVCFFFKRTYVCVYFLS